MVFHTGPYISPDIPKDDFLVPTVIPLPPRPGFGTKGLRTRVAVNAFSVLSFPTSTVYQYDCSLGADGSARLLIEKLWLHPKTQAAFGDSKDTILFDGSRLAWSNKRLPFHDKGLVLTIDLDEGNPRKANAPNNKHRVVIKSAGTVPMQVLESYLNKQCSFDSKVITCITFLDHLIRETPSRRMTMIKRSFFDGKVRSPLSGGVEAWKGIFQSARLAVGDGSLAPNGKPRARMIMNVDVATTVFWSEGTVLRLMGILTGATSPEELEKNWIKEDVRTHREMKRSRKLRFFCTHRERDKIDGPENRKVYSIEGITKLPACEVTFQWRPKRPDGSYEDPITSTVPEYYQKRYNMRLRFPKLPLLETRKKGECFPIEVCYVQKGQRYPYKLNDVQTADMIKFTVTRPQVRQNNIRENVAALGWDKDKILQAYNMRIQPSMIQTNARVLPTPKLQYDPTSKNGGIFKPENGRWDLRGLKFKSVPKQPLESWAFIIFSNPRIVPEASVKNFIRNFITTYQSHGGKVAQKDPPIVYADINKSVSLNLFELFKKAGNLTNIKPQVLFCVLSQKSTQPYNDIKYYMDTSIGVQSQCLQHRHVLQNKPQYCSNVAMKVNAKLGGVTVGLHRSEHPFYGKEPTMFFGADVSHAAPGHATTSYASMVGSTDLPGTRFAAVAGTNGSRVEVISSKNMMKFVVRLLRTFRLSTGKAPQRIYYFRDGVSDGQYQELLHSEVKDLLDACDSLQKGYRPKLTVVVCSKRHHFRFFPQDRVSADKNGNPVPGTIIDRDITHPDEYDFYLASHSAIQGTSRPVHYHVIRDDNKMPVDLFQSFVYNSCYTYMRATNSVSLIPATYYAHLASNRARCHEPILEAGFTKTKGKDADKGLLDPTADTRDLRPNHDLKELHMFTQPTMWFI